MICSGSRNQMWPCAPWVFRRQPTCKCAQMCTATTASQLTYLATWRSMLQHGPWTAMSFKTCRHGPKLDTPKNQNKGLVNTKNQQQSASALNGFQMFFEFWSTSHLWSPPVFHLDTRASFRSGDGTSFSASAASGHAGRPAVYSGILIPSKPGKIGIVAGLRFWFLI